MSSGSPEDARRAAGQASRAPASTEAEQPDQNAGMGSPRSALIALARLDAITRRLRSECPWDREQDELVARKLRVDPELALPAASDRFRSRALAGAELAASESRSWNDLAPEEQLAYYARARLTEGGRHQI